MLRIILLFIFMASLSQAEPYELDKTLHFAVGYGISYTGLHILPTGYKWLAPVAALAAGVAKELTDTRFDKGDMIANTVGVGMSLVIFQFE